jgi:hypothetical protein
MRQINREECGGFFKANAGRGYEAKRGEEEAREKNTTKQRGRVVWVHDATKMLRKTGGFDVAHTHSHSFARTSYKNGGSAKAK